MPGGNFARETDVLYTKIIGAPAFVNLEAVENSCILENIISANNATENDADGQMPIYANPYVAIDKDGDNKADYSAVADTVNGGRTTQSASFSGIAYSLLDILKLVNSNWNVYAEQQDMLKGYYTTWKTWGIDWDKDLPNFVA